MHRLVPTPAPAGALAIAALAMALGPTAATAEDGYVMGPGRWTCAEVIDTVDNGDGARIGQAAGWLMGYWSAATFARETDFVDTVEQVGGQAIYEATVAECRKAPAETLLYLVTKSMISNTK